MEIIIGRDQQTRKLCVIRDGKPQLYGQEGAVPMNVSRQHLAMQPIDERKWQIKNLNEKNVTYVNGAEIVSKKVKQNGMVELGKDRYSISVNTIIETASKIVGAVCPPPPTPPEEYSIKHLKKVWDEYNGKLREIKIRQRNIGLLSSIPMAFSMLGGLIAGVAPEIREYALILTGIALLIMIILRKLPRNFKRSISVLIRKSHVIISWVTCHIIFCDRTQSAHIVVVVLMRSNK